MGEGKDGGPKDAYAINTPTATIGVRGTGFNFNVDAAGTTRVAVFEGSTRTCDRAAPPRQHCIDQIANCNVSVLADGFGPQQIDTTAERRQELLSYFPYVDSQSSLLAAFQLDVDACGISPSDVQTQTPPQPEVTHISAPVIEPPPPPGEDDDKDKHCDGNCGVGNGNGGGDGTGNEGQGRGSDDRGDNGSGGRDNGNGGDNGHDNNGGRGRD